MEERRKTLEERVIRAQPALKNEKLREIVRITDSPSAAIRLAEQKHFHRDKILSCNDLAVLKRDFPEEYQKQIALVEEAEVKRAARRTKKAEEVVPVASPAKKKPGWKEILECVGVAYGTFLFIILCFWFSEQAVNNQKISEQVVTPTQVEQIVAPPVKETAPIAKEDVGKTESEEAQKVEEPQITPPPIVAIYPSMGIPSLLAPQNGVTNLPVYSGGVGFSWSKVGEAENYEVVLSSDPTFKEDNVFARVITSATACKISKNRESNWGGLWYSTTYFWRVRALTNQNQIAGGWSNIGTFTTENAPNPGH